MKRCFKILVFLVIQITIGLVYAQTNKGMEYFQTKQYAKAIPLLQKAHQKDTSHKEITQKLADSYYFTQQYARAELYYEKLMRNPLPEDAVVLRYIEVLKYNKKYEKSKYVQLYFVAKKEHTRAFFTLAHNELMQWQKEDPKAVITTVSGINSELADFSPVIYQNGLVFTSEQQADLTEGSLSTFTQSPYFSVFYAENKKDSIHFKNPNLLDANINHDYHSGPISFNKIGDFACFTKVNNQQQGQGFENKPQLYFSTKKKKRWSAAISFAHNDPLYSYAHGALNESGTILIFTSDMPGGFGGKDLYVSYKRGELWSAPENLGDLINTAKDEVFPSISSDQTLYFSSNGHNGYGGLDIFRSEVNKKGWARPVNMKHPLNSSMDDFGVCILDSLHGYFSSNRSGGLGRDDVYFFELLPEKELKTRITGVFMYDKLRKAMHEKLGLLDDQDSIILLTMTDEQGRFDFKELPWKESYRIKPLNDSLRSRKDAVLFLTNANDEIVQELSPNASGLFAFTPLKSYKDKPLALENIENESFSLGKLFGQVKLSKNKGKALELMVLDGDDFLLESITTDADGNFILPFLSKEKGYKLRLKNTEEGVIDLTDASGSIVARIFIDGNGHYKYQVLAKDPFTLSLLEGNEMLFDLSTPYYGSVERSRLAKSPFKLYLLGEDGSKTEILIDDEGYFSLASLSLYKNYTLLAEGEDVDKFPLSIYGLNSNQQKIEKLFSKQKNRFDLYSLPMEQKDLLPILTDDNTYFDLSGSVFKRLAGDASSKLKVYILDEKGLIIDSALVNAYGNYSFSKLSKDKSYLMKLGSSDDAYQFFVRDEYGKETLIQKNDLGMFEFNKLRFDKANKLALAAFDDEEIAFTGQVFKKLPGDLPKGLNVYLVDQGSNMIDSALIDQLGFFRFAMLPKDGKYKLAVLDEDQGGLVFYTYDQNGDKVLLDKKKHVLYYPKYQHAKNVTLFTILQYPFDEQALSEQHIDYLDVLYAFLVKNPTVKIEVHGHTDNKGTEKYNEELALKRGSQVKTYLMEYGIVADRIILKGFGENFPLYPNQTPDGEDDPVSRSKNRRSEIYVVP